MSSDEGFGLVELMVATAISSIVGAIALTGIVQLQLTSRVAEARQTGQAALSQVLLRLDSEVRYASYVGATTPGQTTVDYQTKDGCVQLRLTGDQLQRRSWSTGTATAWLPIASGVSSANPFTRTTGDRQQLTVDLTAGRQQSLITFTALNTNADTGTATDPCAGSPS
jgi:prepilin-type N-terminal cleavage/methylation domain-containing protein